MLSLIRKTRRNRRDIPSVAQEPQSSVRIPLPTARHSLIANLIQLRLGASGAHYPKRAAQVANLLSRTEGNRTY